MNHLISCKDSKNRAIRNNYRIINCIFAPNMNKKERFEGIINYFKKEMPEVETELVYGNPFQLLVAVILSAQCTDKRVNMVTPKLFQDYPTAEVMAEADDSIIYEYIKSISYPNNKAKHLVGMAKMLMKDYCGEVPDTLDELVRLPGVGRKTANVIQACIFGKAAMAVDTHIFRVSHRLGLVSEKCTTPYSVEKELMKYIPEAEVPHAHHWLLLHGRYVCQSRKPKCEKCGIKEFCSFFKKNSVIVC